MGWLLFVIWYMAAVLPFLIFLEIWHMVADFLNKRKIFKHPVPTTPSLTHGILVVAIIILILLLINGYTW